MITKQEFEKKGEEAGGISWWTARGDSGGEKLKEMDVVRAHLISLSLSLDNHTKSSFSMSNLDQVELCSLGGTMYYKKNIYMSVA